MNKKFLQFNVLSVLVFFFCFQLSAVEYKVAVRAHYGIKEAYIQWQSTIDALNNSNTEHMFFLVPIVDLNEISLRVGKGEFDFVLTNPSSFVEIEKSYGVKALVTLKNKRANTAQERFGSVIFTHVKNKDILSIKDLENKSLMAVSESAFGGWRVAWLEMLNQDFNPYKDLKKMLFTKTGIQADVVRAVRDGVVAAGVVRTDQLERMESKGEIDMRYFRILSNKDIKGFPFFLSTALYPEWVFTATKSLPVDMANKVKATLLSLQPVTKAAKAGRYMGWVEPHDYSSVNELMKRLQVGPYAQ